MKKKNQQRLYCGIDISGSTIDICFLSREGIFEWAHFENNASGFNKLIKLCNKDYHFVMETTGVYHLPLAFFLHEKKCRYSVINALIINHKENLLVSASDDNSIKFWEIIELLKNRKQYRITNG